MPVFLRAGGEVLRACDGEQQRDAGQIPWAGFFYRLDEAALWTDSSAAYFWNVRQEYALDSLLRILLTEMLLPQRGLLLHAATVERRGCAYVFAGRSGAGKSTLASLSPPGSVLTDEISLLRCTGGTWEAYGTPFWGEFRAEGLNRHYPVARIFSLAQAEEDRAERLSVKDGIAALLPNILFFSSEKRRNETLLGLLAALAQAVPISRLHFRRSACFWEVV